MAKKISFASGTAKAVARAAHRRGWDPFATRAERATGPKTRTGKAKSHTGTGGGS